MRVSLPEPGSWKQLGVALAASLIVHAGLLTLGFVFRDFARIVVVKKGEPLFVELPKPEEEPAPRGNPARRLDRPRPPARPAVPKPPAPPAKPAPKAEPARPAPEPAKPSPTPAPPQVAAVEPAPEPAPTPSAPITPKEEPKPEPQAPPASEPRMALAKPHVDLPPSLQRETEGDPRGGGGGLLGGRGGIEGEPVPLDTTDPRYTDYFEKIRRRIKENWSYPREAGERGIGGQLVIEFAIRKDGWIQFVDLKRSSGVQILDRFAMNALKLAQPFPPVPDSVARGALPIAGIFTYQIVDTGLLNQFLR